MRGVSTVCLHLTTKVGDILQNLRFYETEHCQESLGEQTNQARETSEDLQETTLDEVVMESKTVSGMQGERQILTQSHVCAPICLFIVVQSIGLR